MFINDLFETGFKPGWDNPDAEFKSSEPIVRGDVVWARNPRDASSTLTGRVKRIGKSFVFLILKNGEELAVPHKDVSKDFKKLNPNPYEK